MATETFLQTLVANSNPFTRFNEDNALTNGSQWSTGLQKQGADGHYVIAPDNDLSGNALDIDPSGNVLIPNNLTVNGTITGNINVQLVNPIIEGQITSIGTSQVAIEAGKLNVAASNARNFGLSGASIAESPAGTYTVTLTGVPPGANTIAGNTTAAWGAINDIVLLNLQNIVAAGSALNNTVQECTITGLSTFTFDATAAATIAPLSSDAMAFVVGNRASLDGDGLFLRAGTVATNEDVSLTYDSTNVAFASNVDLEFTSNNPFISALSGDLQVEAANDLVIFASNGIVLNASNDAIDINAKTYMTLDAENNIDVTSASGSVTLSAVTQMTLTAFSGDADFRSVEDNVIVYAGTNVTIDASSSIISTAHNITSTVYNDFTVTTADGHINLTATVGLATLQGGSAALTSTTGNTVVTAQGNALLTANTGDINLTSTAGDILATADNNIDLTANTADVNITSTVADVNVIAGANITSTATGLNSMISSNVGSNAIQIEATNLAGGIEMFSGNVTDTSSNTVQMLLGSTVFNRYNQDTYFQVQGEVTNPLLYVTPSYVSSQVINVVSIVGDGTTATVTLSYAPQVPYAIADLVTIAGSPDFDGVGIAIDTVTSTTVFTFLSAVNATDNAGTVTFATALNTEAVGINCVPNGSGAALGEYKLDVNGDFRVQGDSTGISWTTTSDRTFKKNIVSFDNNEAMSIVQQLRPVKYDWRVDEFPEKHFSQNNDLGFIAQEVKELLPQVVKGDKDGSYSVDYARMVSVLTAALQHLSNEVADLKAQLNK